VVVGGIVRNRPEWRYWRRDWSGLRPDLGLEFGGLETGGLELGGLELGGLELGGLELGLGSVSIGLSSKAVMAGGFWIQ
jgi:hypothetical protein